MMDGDRMRRTARTADPASGLAEVSRTRSPLRDSFFRRIQIVIIFFYFYKFLLLLKGRNSLLLVNFSFCYFSPDTAGKLPQEWRGKLFVTFYIIYSFLLYRSGVI